MIGVKSNREKLAGAVARNESALARAQQLLSKHAEKRPPADDADALYLWKREERDIKERVAIAEEALAFAREALRQAEEAEARAKADRDHAAAKKRIEAEEARLVREIARANEAQAERLAALKIVQAERRARNEAREGRSAILDMEHELRSRPGQMRPAIARDYEDWADANGNRVPDQIRDDQGRWIHNPNARHRRTFTEILFEARQDPPKMPTRFGDAITLTALDGSTLWPK